MVKMALDEWELEMNRMLDSFATQAQTSLKIINRRFETLGRPFDDDFRKYFLEVSNQRLDMSFKTVLFSKGPVRHNGTEINANFSSSAKKQSLNSVKNEQDGDLIEIYDSDDDSRSDVPLNQNGHNTQNGPFFGHGNSVKPFDGAESNRGNEVSSAAMIKIDDENDDEVPKARTAYLADDHSEINENTASLEQSGYNQNSDGMHATETMDLDNGNEFKPFVKEESNADGATEMIDIPMIAFDPRKSNTGSKVVNDKGESSKSHQTNTSSNAHSNQSKRNWAKPAKRFKCMHCDSSFQFKYRLEQHQRVHANGRLIASKADSNGLYHCTLCVRRFTDVRNLSKHMKSHKDNRYLYHCARCMCEFFEEAKKDRHESQCEGRHFECHLCKVFVTRIKAQMHLHMRTHSGAKPFRCMICSKYFTTKHGLRYHLNHVHSRNSS